MIDWNEMRDAYEVLPEEVKRKIEERGLAPAKKSNASHALKGSF